MNILCRPRTMAPIGLGIPIVLCNNTHMGTLTPGATYIYERANGVIYARLFGADPKDRFVVGYDNTYIQMQRSKLWDNIVRDAEQDQQLRDMMEKIEVYYRLRYQNTP